MNELEQENKRLKSELVAARAALKFVIGLFIALAFVAAVL